jgi:CRISPR-associated endonuclease/helicase Cas3
MPELRAEQFSDFFLALHGRDPFPWQEALAARVCATGTWPEVIDLPTASGKTACIDVALFALAVREKDAPRRIFFVVDRRVVVDEAYRRVCDIRKQLREAGQGVLHEVAQTFRAMARVGDDDEPLLVTEMRGGAFRDESWINNPLQPTVVTSTVDQVGSRLLFRGYGVSQNRWPLDAGLIGNDALILLDEAHCSRGFAQTLQRVRQYRANGWASQPLNLPFQFVEMTATPSHDPSPENKLELSDQDREVETLKNRLEAEKPTRLIEIKGWQRRHTTRTRRVCTSAAEIYFGPAFEGNVIDPANQWHIVHRNTNLACEDPISATGFPH